MISISSPTAAGVPVVDIRGHIGAGENVSSQFVSRLEAIEAREIVVRIDSNGGSWAAGNAIYVALVQHPAKIIVEIVSAMSAAAFISQAGDHRRMAESGLMMIHRASVQAAGNASELAGSIEFLKQIDNVMITAFSRRSGQSVAKVREMLNAEKFMGAEEARRLGFVDEIMAGKSRQNAAARFEAVASAKACDSFDQLVTNHVASTGCSRTKAISFVAKHNPAAHREFIKNHNIRHGNPDVVKHL